MGHSRSAFAVLQILYHESTSLLSQAHRGKWEGLPRVPEALGVPVTDAAVETSGAGGNRLGGTWTRARPCTQAGLCLHG